jgi:hypothetical protein
MQSYLGLLFLGTGLIKDSLQRHEKYMNNTHAQFQHVPTDTVGV